MIDSLPPELLVQVCSFLCTVSLCRLCGASKALRIALKDDPNAWENALQSTWWYHFDTLKRHDNFTFWCSQYALLNEPPPNNYILYKEVGRINRVHLFELSPEQQTLYSPSGDNICWTSSAALRCTLSLKDLQMRFVDKYACFVCPDTDRFHCMHKHYSLTPKRSSCSVWECFTLRTGNEFHVYAKEKVFSSRIQDTRDNHPSTGRHWIVDDMIEEYQSL